MGNVKWYIYVTVVQVVFNALYYYLDNVKCYIYVSVVWVVSNTLH